MQKEKHTGGPCQRRVYPFIEVFLGQVKPIQIRKTILRASFNKHYIYQHKYNISMNIKECIFEYTL